MVSSLDLGSINSVNPQKPIAAFIELHILHFQKEYDYFYKLNGVLRPLRIVGMKKETAAIAQSARKVSKKQENAVQADAAELNEYVVPAASIGDTNEQILELYRLQWQIEQVFYHLKSLFGYDDVPNKRDGTGTNVVLYIAPLHILALRRIPAFLINPHPILELAEELVVGERLAEHRDKLFGDGGIRAAREDAAQGMHALEFGGGQQ